MTELETKIKALQARCGTYATAKYLRARGYSLDEALNFLVYKRS